jgi:schlafen family protein
VTIFGVSWDELEPQDVAAFLADAEDEALLWESKGGGGRPNPGSVRKAVCGFANSRGGYLIIGADRRDGAWSVDGVDFGVDEPGTWLDSVIRDGLRPVPAHEVRVRPGAGGRTVAIVRVQPIAAPPCITSDGVVYLRVSGRTVPVTDPAVLAGLYERGRAAEQHAENAARRRAEELVRGSDPGEPPFLNIGIALCPTGIPDDLGGRLFTESFEQHAREVVLGLPTEPLLPGGAARGATSASGRDLVTVQTPIAEGVRHRWDVRAYWDGAVGVMLAVVPDRDDESFTDDAFFDDAVRPLKEAAIELVAELRGYGRAHVVLQTLSRGCSLRPFDGSVRQLSMPNGLEPIRDWTEDDGTLSEEAFGRMRRQLLRALGVKAWEPERNAGAP